MKGGSSGKLELVLQPLNQSPVPSGKHAVGDTLPSADASQDYDGQEKPSDTLAWIALGGSTAITTAGVVFLVLALNDKARVQDANDPDTWKDIQASYDRVPVFSTVGFVLLGVGVAGIATSVVLLSSSSSEAPPQLSLGVTPTGLMLEGVL